MIEDAVSFEPQGSRLCERCILNQLALFYPALYSKAISVSTPEKGLISQKSAFSGFFLRYPRPKLGFSDIALSLPGNTPK